MDQLKMTLGMAVGLGPGHIVLDVDPPPLPQKGPSVSQFSAHVYCGQTAGWIKMPLGTDIGFGPGDIVLDGDQAPPKKGAQPPIFGPCLLWPNGCICQDTSWYVSIGLSLGNIVLDGDPAPPPLKGHITSIFGQCPLWPNGWMD